MNHQTRFSIGAFTTGEIIRLPPRVMASARGLPLVMPHIDRIKEQFKGDSAMLIAQRMDNLYLDFFEGSEFAPGITGNITCFFKEVTQGDYLRAALYDGINRRARKEVLNYAPTTLFGQTIYSIDRLLLKGK